MNRGTKGVQIMKLKDRVYPIIELIGSGVRIMELTNVCVWGGEGTIIELLERGSESQNSEWKSWEHRTEGKGVQNHETEGGQNHETEGKGVGIKEMAEREGSGSWNQWKEGSGSWN